MPTLVEHARTVGRASALAAWTTFSVEGVLLRMRSKAPDARHTIHQRWLRRWARGLLRVFNVHITQVSAPPPAAQHARLIVSNHRSPGDIILLLSYFGGCVLSRSDLSSWPILGRAAIEGGTIFVDRDDRKSGASAIREIRRRLQRGHTVIVFPEGTTHRGDEVHPFLEGAFAAARGLQVELCPVGIAYEPGSEYVQESFGRHLQRMAGRTRTSVAVCFGTPQMATGDRGTIARQMREQVSGLVSRARAGLNSPR